MSPPSQQTRQHQEALQMHNANEIFDPLQDTSHSSSKVSLQFDMAHYTASLNDGSPGVNFTATLTPKSLVNPQRFGHAMPASEVIFPGSFF